MAIIKLIHVLAVLIWVGGMFFAYVVLRPAAVEVFEPQHRLRIWNPVFRRFFVWVWSAIAVLLLSGFYMIYLYGGFTYIPVYVHAMLTMGILMIAIYTYVYFVCYKPFSLHVVNQDWKEAGELLGKIRKLIAANLGLGLLTVCVAVLGAH